MGLAFGNLSWTSTVGSSIVESMTTEETKRQEAIFELIATEQNYVRDLQVILDIFYVPLASLLSIGELHGIFSNIEDLLICNSVILSDMDAVQKNGNFVVKQIGACFLRHVCLISLLRFALRCIFTRIPQGRSNLFYSRLNHLILTQPTVLIKPPPRNRCKKRERRIP